MSYNIKIIKTCTKCSGNGRLPASALFFDNGYLCSDCYGAGRVEMPLNKAEQKLLHQTFSYGRKYLKKKKGIKKFAELTEPLQRLRDKIFA